MPTQAVEPLSREERFVRTNHRLGLAFVAAFGAWQLAEVIRRWAPGEPRLLLAAVSLAAWGTWAALLVVLMRRGRALKGDAALLAAVQDERARDVRLRAYRAAFWCTLGAAALLAIPAEGSVLPAFAATRLVVVVGVAAFIVACVVLDRG
jgi:hypothetical protein